MADCASCGLKNVDGLSTCPICKAALRAPRRITDDSVLERHTRGVPLGRVRPATLEEGARREDLFRPDAVLSLAGALPSDLSVFEMHIAALIDGMRPVARIRKKSGVTSADLRIALGALADRKLLLLTGIVEEAVGEVATEISRELAANEVLDAADFDVPTLNQAVPDIIPPHVMAEIQSMIDDDDELDLDEDTDAPGSADED